MPKSVLGTRVWVDIPYSHSNWTEVGSISMTHTVPWTWIKVGIFDHLPTRFCYVVFEWPLVWYAYARSLNSHGVATRIRAARARAGESYAAQWGPFLYEVALYFFKAWVAKTSMRKNFKSCVQWVCVQRYKYLQFW